jgi:hypothetical protein
MKITLTIDANSLEELIDQLREFIRQHAPIVDAKAEDATVTETTPPKAAKKANGKAKPKEEKIECSDKPLTEAEVRSIMIDFVNVAAEKQPDMSRKEIFKKLLDAFKVDKLADLPEDKYQAMVDLVASVKAGL